MIGDPGPHSSHYVSIFFGMVEIVGLAVKSVSTVYFCVNQDSNSCFRGLHLCFYLWRCRKIQTERSSSTKAPLYYYHHLVLGS